MTQTQHVEPLPTNPSHDCPICGAVLQLEDAGDPQTWECPRGHSHIQSDCCETIYLDTVQ